MRKVLSRPIAVLLGCLLIAGYAPFAGAQETAEDEFILEEITVTAQKRSENQQKVSMAMEVVSSEDIRTTGKNDLGEILSNIASAVIGMDEDGLRISLRGMGDDSTAYHGQSTAMPTVALNMDGVYSNRRDTGAGLFDLERVEVLYGPQSTLYASNSPGGIVNVITASPKLGIYEASGSIEYGNYETLKTQGAMNIPMGESVALRAAYSTSVHDGYLSNGGSDEDIKSARLRALYQPTDSFSLTVTGELSKNTGHFFGKVDQFEDEGDLDDPWYTDSELSAPSNKDSKKIYAQMDVETGIGTLSLVPSYSKTDGHEEQYDALMGTTKQDSEGEEKGAELRISSPADSFMTWIVGLNYYDSSDILDQVTYDGSEPNGEMRYGSLEEEAKAVFTNVTYPVSDVLRATAGFRYSWDDIDVYRYEVMAQPDGFRVDEVDWSSSYSEPDYKLGVEYDLAENSMIYADFSTSYRAQGMRSEVSGNISTPPPEKLKAYTIGAKNRFFDNKFQVNAAAYYYDYRNYFVQETRDAYYGTDLENPTSEFTESDPGGTTWGDGHMMGIDIQTTTVITPKDIVGFSVSYLKSEWTDLYFDYEYDWEVVTDTRTAPGQIIPIEIIAMEDADYEGKSMTHAPEWTLNASYRHIFNLWNGGTLEARIDVNYKSDFTLTWDDGDAPYNYQEAFTKTDLSLSYNHSDGKWGLSGYVRNLEDYAEKRGYSSRGDTRIGTPRTIGAVLNVRF